MANVPLGSIYARRGYIFAVRRPGLVEATVKRLAGPNPDPLVVESTELAFRGTRLDTEMPRNATVEELASLAAPVMVLAGQHDPLFPPASASRARAVPELVGAQTLDGCRHILDVDVRSSHGGTDPAARRQLWAKPRHVAWELTLLEHLGGPNRLQFLVGRGRGWLHVGAPRIVADHEDLAVLKPRREEVGAPARHRTGGNELACFVVPAEGVGHWTRPGRPPSLALAPTPPPPGRP